MLITLKNSNKKKVLKQHLFIGNWDKSIAIDGKQFIDILQNNDTVYSKLHYLIIRIESLFNCYETYIIELH